MIEGVAEKNMPDRRKRFYDLFDGRVNEAAKTMSHKQVIPEYLMNWRKWNEFLMNEIGTLSF